MFFHRLLNLLSPARSQPVPEGIKALEASLSSFVVAMPQGAAVHRSPIANIHLVMEAISEHLKAQGLTGKTIVPLLDQGLIAICTRCGSPVFRDRLQAVWLSQNLGGSVVFSDGDGGAARLTQGRCALERCPSTELLYFWSPDLLAPVAGYLGSLGLSVDPASAQRRDDILAGVPRNVVPPIGTK